MTACLCGCALPVKPGRRYATPGCGGRAHLRSRPRADIIRAGREGGKAWKVSHRQQVLDRVRGMSFEDAVLGDVAARPDASTLSRLSAEGGGMTHDELVTRAAAWLRNKQRCKVVLTETSAGYDAQVPDALGWTWRGECFEIECKTSLSDFRADRKKLHRQPGAPSLGTRRYYLLPVSLGVHGVPEGWGLLLAQKRGLLTVTPAPANTSRDLTAEATLLVAVLARYQSQGIAYKTLREQHAEERARYASDLERGLHYGAEAEAQALMGRLGMR